MKRILSFLAVLCTCIGLADAAVRTTNLASRDTNTTTSRTTVSRGQNQSVSSRGTTARAQTIPQRKTVQRATTPTNTARTTAQRTATTASRSATTVARTAQTQSVRAAKTTRQTSRAAVASQTFGAGYNSCRDAYFTCMDQFCATADDTYRRCICSSRLSEIKTKQRALGDAADQIQEFKDLNIEVIPKTAAEVNAMMSATKGEYTASVVKDTSDSAKKLAGISAVLSNTKSKSLSTAGTLDIAGDINAIWATTDLASGANIANLTGETLYNAVHSQCADLVADHCESKSTLNMVVSAYAMYIENDCTLLSNTLGKQKNSANAAIRETERDMQTARLENYNAHNSTSINDCVAKVRNDITAETACGSDYVHCLDVSGLYLNKTTGEPIYTADFYQLETMVSLSGDVLTNQTNRLLVAELNRKRTFAEHSLSTCQDLADDVWDEFMRQAITEIYQGQQSRIRQVKDECLDVVNKCYDAQSDSLRDFSNTKEQLLLGSRLELSEQLCQEKLAACSNLYGGGSDGLQELVATMHNITSQKIAQNCLTTLQEYAASICAVPSSDTLHSYPYACRVYEPGEQKYAMIWECQNKTQNQNKNSTIASSSYNSNSGTGSSGGTNTGNTGGNSGSGGYACLTSRKYIRCNTNYYLSDCHNTTPFPENVEPSVAGNACLPCPDYYTCAGGTTCPQSNSSTNTDDIENQDKCHDYVGSLYQKIVRYALQACERPSKIESITDDTQTTPISNSVLQDVNTTMDSIRLAMSASLQTECERLGGYWVTTQYTKDDTSDLYTKFYDETGANTKWGYCANPSTTNTVNETQTTTDTSNEENSD